MFITSGSTVSLQLALQYVSTLTRVLVQVLSLPPEALYYGKVLRPAELFCVEPSEQQAMPRWLSHGNTEIVLQHYPSRARTSKCVR